MRASRSADGSIRATLVSGLELELADPRHMSMVAITPAISEASSIIADEQVNNGIATVSIQTMMCRLACAERWQTSSPCTGTGSNGGLDPTAQAPFRTLEPAVQLGKTWHQFADAVQAGTAWPVPAADP